MKPVFSIIILNHDKADYTFACLTSLLLSADENLEVIAVDNGSKDSTHELLDTFKARFNSEGIGCKLILNPTNVGAVTGRNQALEVAEGGYIVFMDNDVLVKDADWLSKLRAVLDAEERRGIVSPKLLFPWAPFDIEFAGGAVSPQGRVGYLGRGEPRDAPEHNVEREVQCVISACIMIKRNLFDEVGLLDEAYNPVQFEDIDLCYRARAVGWKVIYTPKVEMFHFENVTTEGSKDLNFRYLTIRNGLRFKERWRHMFEVEGGPPDEQLRWKPIERKGIHDVFGTALDDSASLQERLRHLMSV